MRTTYNNKEDDANSAGAVGADAAVVAAAAAHPVLAEFEWLRKDRAPGVCWSTHPERAHTRQRGKEAKRQSGKVAKRQTRQRGKDQKRQRGEEAKIKEATRQRSKR